MSSAKPPQQEATIGFTKTIRYTNSSTTSTMVNLNNETVLNVLTMGIDGTHVSPLPAGVKVNRIKIWAPPQASAAASASTCSVQWLSEQGPTTIKSDVGMGATFGAYIDTRPPRNSLASFWRLYNPASNPTLAFVLLPSYAVVDIEFAFRLQNSYIASSEEADVLLAVTSATPGTVYVMPLDYVHDATALVIPLTYATTS